MASHFEAEESTKVKVLDYFSRTSEKSRSVGCALGLTAIFRRFEILQLLSEKVSCYGKRT